MKPNLDVKIRSCLIRLISGKYKVDRLTNSVDKVILHAVVETLHREMSKSIQEILKKTVLELPQDTLAMIIAENKYLSDVQKAQIASILHTPSQRDNSTGYLG